ncbi:MAG TPA: acyl carrier protein [Dongiaceae bacterium]|nr:acyl carrier protein [Dongiaceae bacterium]
MSTQSTLGISALKSFVVEELAMGRPVNETSNLLAEGVIDSIRLLRLVSFIEETYGITVPDQDMTVDNFRSLDTIAAFIARQSASTKA